MNEDGLLYLDEDEPEDEDIDYSDRVAIFIRPKEPFIDWINELVPDDPMTEDDFIDGNTYFADLGDIIIDDQDDVDELLLKYFTMIFEYELADMWENTEDWPQKVSLEMFKEWFEYRVSTEFIDLG